MLNAIFKYIWHLFYIVRMLDLLFLSLIEVTDLQLRWL